MQSGSYRLTVDPANVNSNYVERLWRSLVALSNEGKQEYLRKKEVWESGCWRVGKGGQVNVSRSDQVAADIDATITSREQRGYITGIYFT